MRAVVVCLLLCLLLGACVGARPAVTPLLSQLPAETEKRDAVLERSQAQPTPEQRPTGSRRARKVETYAATAAATLGWLFSKTKTVTVGTAGLFEEAPSRRRPTRPQHDDEGASKSPPPPVATSGGEVLVPWIRLK